MDIQKLSNLVFGDTPVKRDRWFQVFRNGVFVPRYNISLPQSRKIAYSQLKAVTDAKLLSIKDFINDPVNIFTAHQMLSQVAPSAVVKLTVQFNLFGGSLIALSTQRHRHIFDKVDSLQMMGCFCLTELGYGNNAVQMQTTVTYDKNTDEFVVNSPTTLSKKYWITNGAIHANQALVFGQTIINSKNQGVNAFLVEVRDKEGNQKPGVKIWDMGYKIGLNGIDNAIVSFKNVRIPRTNMMNRYSDLNNKAQFTASVKGLQQRFFKVTQRLLSGRICISSMNFGGTRQILYITIKYAKQRLAVGANGKSDTPIFNYQLQQNALMPLLARTLSLNMFHNRVKKIFAKPQKHQDWLSCLCSADKCLSGWNFQKVVTVCRERCGGQGFLAANKFAQGLASAHAALTAQGDNRVLMVKISKDIITNHSAKGYKFPESKVSNGFMSLNFIYNLLLARYKNCYNELTKRSMDLISQGKSKYNILMYQTSQQIQKLSNSYGQLQVIQQCINVYEGMDDGNKPILQIIFRLFGVDCVKNDLAYFIQQGLLTINDSKEVERMFVAVVKSVAKECDNILQILNVPVHALYTPIASNYIKYNQINHEGQVINAKL